METNGEVTVEAERLSQAAARVERLGCSIVHARPAKPGVFVLGVSLTLSAANALAQAVLRRELVFSRRR